MEELVKEIVEKIKNIDDIQIIFKENKNIFSFEVNNSFSPFDMSMILIHKRKVNEFNIIIKKNLSTIHLIQLEHLNTDFKKLIIFIGKTTPNLRSELKKKNINYADSAGNLFLKTKTFIFYIEGNKYPDFDNQTPSLSFTATDLKLIFNLLTDERLIFKSYRDITKMTKISLQPLSKIFNYLQSKGFILNINNRNKKIVRKKELFEKWVLFYGEVLKPKMRKGKYRCLNKDFSKIWQNINLDSEKSKWGGESAAYILTNYLRPEFHTIYSDENNDELLKKYKFVRDINGNIEIFNKFWLYDNIENLKIMNLKNCIVHPIIIYADLLNTNNPRNIEAAKIIYNQYIDEFISKT